MSASPSTIQAVSTLLSADSGVSADFRLAVMEGLTGSETVNLNQARALLGVGRTTLWRMRKQGRLNLALVKHPNAKETRVTLSSVVKPQEKV